ncbi:MAG: type II toxin-antitoxin system RelE/ParE family toxin [Gammaproteobacteria bacterium]|nr:type II toxin-antitoxin system RelE/ParE family toxin [Gammaproteobacteria bacterium]
MWGGALRPLQEGAIDIAQDPPQATARRVLPTERSVASLANRPHLGRAGRMPGTRAQVIVGTPCRVSYGVQGQRVDILRVFHGQRRWPSQR